MQGYGDSGFVAGGGEDGSARDGGIGWQRESERRAVYARGGGDEIPDVYGFVVVGARPAVGYLAGIGCGHCGLTALKEDARGEEVIFGSPGLEFFGFEGRLIGRVELALAPLNERELDDCGSKPGRGGMDGFEGMPGLIKLLRGLLLEGRVAGHEESEGGSVRGRIRGDGLLPFGFGIVIVPFAPD